MTDVFLVLGCHIDLTDPEPNVWVNNIYSEQRSAEAMVASLQEESPDCWWGWFKRTVDSKDSGISLDKNDVDMELFY